MKKLISAALVLCLVFALGGCSGNKLPKGYDEDEVIARGKEIVEIANAMDYEGLFDQLQDDLKAQVSVQQLEEAWDKQLHAAGSFQKYSQVVTAGTKDPNSDVEYAVVVLVCKYENATLTFTISMDESLELVGLYMK